MGNSSDWLHLMALKYFTLDKNFKNQQNLNKVDLTFILLVAKDNKHQTLQLFIKKIKDLLIMKNIPKFNEISL